MLASGKNRILFGDYEYKTYNISFFVQELPTIGKHIHTVSPSTNSRRSQRFPIVIAYNALLTQCLCVREQIY